MKIKYKDDKIRTINFNDLNIGDVYRNDYGAFMKIGPTTPNVRLGSVNVVRLCDGVTSCLDPNSEKVGHKVKAKLVISSFSSTAE